MGYRCHWCDHDPVKGEHLDNVMTCEKCVGRDFVGEISNLRAGLDRYEKIKTEAIKLVRLIESAGFCSIQIDMLRMAIGDAEEANREEG